MTDEQRRAFAAAFGLAEDATVEQVEAAAAAAAEQRTGEPPESVHAPEPEREPEPVAASDRTVTVTREQWQEMQTRIAAAEADLTTRREREQRQHRDGVIAAAVQDGRIAPSERDQWRSDLDEAPEATERIIARLEPNRIPVQARGVDRSDADDLAAVGEGTGWFSFDGQEG